MNDVHLLQSRCLILSTIDKGNAVAQEKWIFGYNDVKSVKEYVQENGIGNSSNANGLTGFLTEFDSNFRIQGLDLDPGLNQERSAGR